MKIFVLMTAALLAGPVFASDTQNFPTATRFECPEKWSFAPTWLKAVRLATYNLEQTALNDDRSLAYDHFYSSKALDDDLMSSEVKIGDGLYDLALKRSNYFWDQEFADAYAVVFKEGTSLAVGTIESDTFSSNLICKSFLAPTVILPADEFLSLTIDSPQGVNVTVRDIPYQNFTVISATLAYGENEKNEFVQFIPALSVRK